MEYNLKGIISLLLIVNQNSHSGLGCEARSASHLNSMATS